MPILLLLLLNYFLVYSQTPSNDTNWYLIWEDNFNSLNTTIWDVKNNFDHYSGKYSPNDGEPQVYTNRQDNVFIDNANLVLKIKIENYICPESSLALWGCSRQNAYGIPYNFTSGWVETKQSYKPKFGYIEAKIKLPYGTGFWPAFWLHSNQIQNGTPYQEIDIFEMVPGRYEDCVYLTPSEFTHNFNQLTTNLHYVENSGTDLCTSNFRVFSINDYRQWHIYGVEWSPSKITWYVDGNPYRTEANNGIWDYTRIILNFALNPLVDNYNFYDFPAEMRVDYVKFYKLKNDCNNTVNVCNYDFNNHTNTVKKSITIGGTNCYNKLQNNQNIFMRSSEGILINGDFEVPVGNQIYLDVNTCY